MKKWMVCLLSGLLIAASAHAANPKVSRPAAKADLIGTWDLVSVRPIHDKKDPAFYPYQRYVFDANSSMKFMVSDKAITGEWLDKFKKQPAEIYYTVSEKGLLTLTWNNKPFSESAVAVYVVQDLPKEVTDKMPAAEKARVPRKGNIVLSFLNKAGKIAYQKVFFKVG